MSWQELEAHFAELHDLAAAEREARLTSLDPDVARQLRALLAADADAHPAFERGADELAQVLGEDERVGELVGQTFDAYVVEEHLSSGGMGHVYRATRTSEGIARRVAIKVLRRGHHAEDLLRRFQDERAMLASLEHEHIVTFLDAGTLPDGRPYLVMEFIDGVPLTDWCAGVDLKARLRLSIEVLSALQYAHQQLVVHRDLKPSNLLVTGQGTPKLLDFGVASVLDDRDGAVSERAPLTPEYASPEAWSGRSVTTGSDLYSIGQLFREAWGADLPRDLRCVLDRATAEAPSQRYPSADRMADDVRAFLEGLPVAARRPTPGYLLGRFVTRNRWPVVALTSLILLLSMSVVGEAEGRLEAEEEASVGWSAHAQAKYVANLFEQLVTDNAAAVPFLEAALAELDEPGEAEAMVRLTLARVLIDDGRGDEAREHLVRVRALLETTRGLGKAERERTDALWAELQG